GVSWGEWTPCTRSCGGGISRQQKRCRRKPCKGRPWNIKYKVCNVQPCDKPIDHRTEQCSNFDNVPYDEQLLKWYPYYDPSRPCALICRGVSRNSKNSDGSNDRNNNVIATSGGKSSSSEHNRAEKVSLEDYESAEGIVVQLAEKVEDGTKCYPDTQDVCVNGECMRVGCDMRVGSNRIRDACGVCGGDGTNCNVKYSWSLESTSACSESCGGGFKIATSVCKTTGVEKNIVDSSKCNSELKPEKVLVPCNTHSCSTKWMTGDWSKCSVSCGGGSRSRAVFCIEENGNATSKLPSNKCNANRKPKFQEICNAFSCPMWETGEWSECSSRCGKGLRTRSVECRDGNGRLSDDCNLQQRPRSEQECRASPGSIECSNYGDEMPQPMAQSYQMAPVPEKLIDQPVPSQATFIADEWSPCSVTCGEGVRKREVRCKIFLEFSRTVAELPDHQCSGLKPLKTEKCIMEPCNLLENSLAYRVDTVGDSSYAEPSLTDSYSSASGGGGSGSSQVGAGGSSATTSAGGHDANVKVAPGSSVKTTYSWKEVGYTDCSATCLGGVQDLIITCVRDDTKKTVMPLLCSAETKPESRIRVCNDHPCPPRWNTSEFSPCMSPCGLGIQTREVTCIHEVTRGTANTVAVPSHMCPQPPPADRQYCNVWDCPVAWKVGEWGKCSKTCGGGVKRRQVSCEQTMAQGRVQSKPERDCPTPKPRSEKECNGKACEQLSASAQASIVTKNNSYVQPESGKKISLDIGGHATIFQGTPVLKIRCPVKKFDKAHLVWKKDDEEIRKSKKFKINKKGALKIVDINLSDAGVYSCWAGQTSAGMRITVKAKTGRDLMSNEEVLRSGNAVHQRQGAHLSSAPVNSEPFYSVYNEENQESKHERAASSTEKPRRNKKQKQATSELPDEPTGKYEYSVTPQLQPAESVAASSASTLMPHLSHVISTIKNYWSSPQQPSAMVSQTRTARHETGFHLDAAPLSTSSLHLVTSDDTVSPARFDFFHGNTAIPDNEFGPDEERIFIDDDDDPFSAVSLYSVEPSSPHHISSNSVSPSQQPTVTILSSSSSSSSSYNTPDTSQSTWHARHHHGSTERRHYHHHELQEVTRHPKDHSDNGLSSLELVTNEMDSGSESSESDLYELGTSASPASPSEDLSQEDESTVMTTTTTTEDNSIGVSPSTNGEEISDGEETVTENEPEVTVTLQPERKVVDEPVTVMQGRPGKDMARNAAFIVEIATTRKSVTPVVIGSIDGKPTVGPVESISKVPKDDLIFEWVTTDWSRCTQTCGGGGFQMRGAQCTVRSLKNESDPSRISLRTVIGASLCEDAGYPVPEKVRPCGGGKCPQWQTSEWSPCETSRCFNWKTAMQRREISCLIAEESDNRVDNTTLPEPVKCDEASRPPQRQECYNDACKGVWRVGEWSECSGSCEEDGIKYRILQCVWYGTKKPAGNACRDIPRPPVMKTCRGPPCPKASDECKDHSQLCSRVKLMKMCRVPLYGKQCCKSCHQDRHV
ncbi:hypothetical protein QAD02_019125, partial [Eretmocerus hayati]